MDVSDEGALSLLTAEGEPKDDLNLPTGTDDLDSIAKQITAMFAAPQYKNRSRVAYSSFQFGGAGNAKQVMLVPKLLSGSGLKSFASSMFKGRA